MLGLRNGRQTMGVPGTSMDAIVNADVHGVHGSHASATDASARPHYSTTSSAWTAARSVTALQTASKSSGQAPVGRVGALSDVPSQGAAIAPPSCGRATTPLLDAGDVWLMIDLMPISESPPGAGTNVGHRHELQDVAVEVDGRTATSASGVADRRNVQRGISIASMST